MSKTSIIDWQDSIALMSNNVNAAEELLEMFVQQLADYKQKIRTELENANYKGVGDHAHSLHGSLCYVSIPALKTTARALETACKNQDLSQITKLIEKVEAQMVLVEKEYTSKAYLE